MDCMSQVFKRMGRLRSELSRGCLSGLNGCREPHYLPGFLLQTWRLQTFVWIQRTGILLDIQWSIHAFCYTFWLWFFWMIVLFYCLNIFLQWNEWLIIIKSSCSPLDLIFLSVNWLCLSPMKHTSVAASKWPVKYCQSAIIWVGLECWYIWFFLFGLDQYWFKGLCLRHVMFTIFPCGVQQEIQCWLWPMLPLWRPVRGRYRDWPHRLLKTLCKWSERSDLLCIFSK